MGHGILCRATQGEWEGGGLKAGKGKKLEDLEKAREEVE